MKKIAFVIGVLILAGCTRPEKATRILENDGYEGIKITGFKWFACAEEDWYQTGFIAEKNGKRIEGTVCEGLFFKGSTIRLD